MKPSKLTAKVVSDYLRLDEEPSDLPLELLLAAASGYTKNYTGLTAEQMDQYEDITIAILVLCSDMYDNRQMVVENNQVNRVVQSILDLHSVNLL